MHALNDIRYYVLIVLHPTLVSPVQANNAGQARASLFPLLKKSDYMARKLARPSVRPVVSHTRSASNWDSSTLLHSLTDYYSTQTLWSCLPNRVTLLAPIIIIVVIDKELMSALMAD